MALFPQRNPLQPHSGGFVACRHRIQAQLGDDPAIGGRFREANPVPVQLSIRPDREILRPDGVKVFLTQTPPTDGGVGAARGKRGLKREPKTCGPLNKLLAQYNFMASHIEEFTPDEAKEFLELDRTISPTVRGKVTAKAWARFVTKPLELAHAQAPGDVARALQLVKQVLYVDPKNPEALALDAELTHPKDAGR